MAAAYVLFHIVGLALIFLAFSTTVVWPLCLHRAFDAVLMHALPRCCTAYPIPGLRTSFLLTMDPLIWYVAFLP